MTITRNKIKTIAYRLLARRDYSSISIEQKLITKGFASDEITPVLAELSREGAINDQRFVENYIRYRQNHGYGPLRIRQELQTQGLAKEMIEDQLDITDNAWFAEVKKVWQKRFRGKKPSNLQDQGKQLRFLQYRGFTQEQIDFIFDQ